MLSVPSPNNCFANHPLAVNCSGRGSTQPGGSKSLASCLIFSLMSGAVTELPFEVLLQDLMGTANTFFARWQSVSRDSGMKSPGFHAGQASSCQGQPSCLQITDAWLVPICCLKVGTARHIQKARPYAGDACRKVLLSRIIPEVPKSPPV